MIYTFDELTLDDERYVLQRNDQALKLEPKVLDLLVYLLRHRDRVVLKNELITELWPDQVVSEAALTHCVAKARKAVHDDGGSQRVIKTLHGRGYRFVAEVVVGQPPSIQEAGGAPTPSPVVVPLTIGHPWEQRRLALIGVLLVLVSFTVGPLVFSSSRSAEAVLSKWKAALRLPDKPSLAVLPFATHGDDAGQLSLSSGLTEDLITRLSRISGLFVVARNTPVLYQGKAVSPQQVRRELGVQYVLEGSVRRAGDQVRITAQLVDAATGQRLWAQRYDRSWQDLFALQDDITQKIVAALAIQLKAEERSRLVQRYTKNVEAYDSTARGWDYFLRYTHTGNQQARQLFSHALTLDPHYALAYVGLGRTYCLEWLSVWNQDPAALERASDLARQALQIDASLPPAHALLGDVYLLKRQHASAMAEAEQAITLDPTYAYGYAALAEMFNFTGQPEEAVRLLVEKAMRLDPDAAAYYSTILGHSYFLLKRYAEAIAALKRTLTRNPDYLLARLRLAMVYSEAGQHQEAKAHFTHWRELSPNGAFDGARQTLPYKERADLERTLAALRNAGLQP